MTEERYGAELDAVIDQLQDVIPSGQYMAIGRMQAAEATRERLERLATMEAGVRAADRLTDAGHISVNAERRYIGSIDDDMAALLDAVELLETEVPDGGI